MKTQLFHRYGLKFNPFNPDIPTEALYRYSALEDFLWRVEQTIIQDGGFALVSGESGTGKSTTLRLLVHQLSHLAEVQVGVITHPSATLCDFYRELGDIFGVPLNANNRWNGFKLLRERWAHHLKTTLVRPVLIIDEAQEMPACVLNEVRLLTSTQFDSKLLLCIILAGDTRLTDKLRHSDLIPLGSRIRSRFNIQPASPEQLLQALDHLLTQAGNSQLMTTELKQTLSEHAMGNFRVLCAMAGELLAIAAKQELTQLDEKLFLQCFAAPQKSSLK